MNRWQYSQFLYQAAEQYHIPVNELENEAQGSTLQERCKKIQKHLSKKQESFAKFAAKFSGYHQQEIQSILSSRRKKKKPPFLSQHRIERSIRPLRPQGKQWDNTILIGADSETAYNRKDLHPDREQKTISMQFYHPSTGSVFIRNPMKGMDLLDHLYCEHPSYFDKQKTTIFLFHNLAFDIYAMFGKEYSLFFEKNDHVTIAVFGVQSFIRMKYRGHKILFLDTANFFPGKLETVAHSMKLEHRKLEPPPWLGEKEPETEEEWQLLEEYANIDAVLTYELGLLIKQSQQLSNIGITPTLAGASYKNFCTNYLKTTLFLPQEKEISNLWYYAKHGALFQAFRRGFDEKQLWAYYDVNGLYSHIMMTAPLPFSIGYTREWEEATMEKIRSPAYEGCCKVWFSFPRKRRYPCLPVVSNKLYFTLQGVSYCTFAEVKLALEMGARIKLYGGWCWKIDPSMDVNHDLAQYAAANAKIKDLMSSHLEGFPDSPEAGLWRIQRKKAKDDNNTIYGKSGQVTVGKPGPFYHPAIGSLILAYAKVYMFRKLLYCEEHHIPVAYVDTDCLMVPMNSLPSEWLSESECGKLKNETPEGFHPFVVRSKFYTCIGSEYTPKKMGHHAIRITTEEEEKKWSEKLQFPVQFLTKKRFIAFLLSSDQFELKYSKIHFTKLKESLHSPLGANKIEVRDFTINLSEDGKRLFLPHKKSAKGLRSCWIESRPLVSIS